MAVLLNDLFFPKYDPFVNSLLNAFAFCSTFVFRPVGAIIFGWIGDNIGRKAIVIITTAIMAITCIITATLSPYSEIGIAATIVITLCRVAQGISSMGEIMGTQIYLTEITKPPTQYSSVAMIVTASTVGGVAALGIASIVTSYSFSWRIAFWMGAVIAVIGLTARTTLRETPVFADAKRQLQESLADAIEKGDVNIKKLKNHFLLQEKVNKKTCLAYFLIECAWPVSFYFTYSHCSNILKNTFGYTSEQIIHNNFIVSMVNLGSYIILTYLCYKIYPLILIKFRLLIFWLFAFIYPYLLSSVASPFEVLFIQSFFIIFRPDAFPAVPIYIKHFPIFKRFTYPSWLFALSRALMHIITSFGLVFLVKYFDNWGVLFILIPVSIGFTWGILYFEKLDKVVESYPQTSLVTVPADNL
ncbi:MFS transporter [Rickettsia hoogstraalii]|uniref:MFS transporter n=1 Tax=Rickettsia hoogstraalii TaxID=467174 RepID=UPI000AEF4937